MAPPRQSSVDRAHELGDHLIQAYNIEYRVTGGFYRLEIISAVLRFVEAITRLDPGFLAAIREAINGRQLSQLAPEPAPEPARHWIDSVAVIVNNASYFIAGVTCASLAISVVMALAT